MNLLRSSGGIVARHRVIEFSLTAPLGPVDPFHETQMSATLIAPSGRQVLWQGFWDGGNQWRVRFAPDEEGSWHYVVNLHGPLRNQPHALLASDNGTFICTPALDATPFDQHGPLRVAENKHHLVHADGTPFFWLADTAWNGPLRSTPEEWQHYLAVRTRQRFSAVQWVTTQWRTAPDGDITGQVAFTGSEKIALNPAFFQRLDSYVEANAAAGLLNVPVLLWAIGAGANPNIDPGFGLPEDQAIKLARYMVARWGAYPVVWILAGDGKYFGDYAARWRRIGRAVFADQHHAPVAMHCGGEQWPANEFRGEIWLDILGYQSGHGDADKTLQWIVTGPPAAEWQKTPRLFQINLEPAYENHLAYHSKQPHSPHSVRSAMYWSLLNAPTAGVTYGGHGVWGWDDGTTAPVAHANTGTPLPWQQALTMPAAEQLPYLVDFFTSLPWWTLEPAPQLLAEQPGEQDVHRHVLASAAAGGELAVFYTPVAQPIHLNVAQLQPGLNATWCNPATGTRHTTQVTQVDGSSLTPPAGGADWLLVLQKAA